MKTRKLIAVFLAFLLLSALLPVSSLAAASSRNKNPTCTEEGYVVSDGVRTVLPPLGHDWGPWITTHPGNCIRQGHQTRTCSRCGATESQTGSYGPHNWRNYWVTTVEATCAAEGERERECQHCGKKETQPIEKLPHTWGEWSVLVKATQEAPGTLVRSCQVCGEQETKEYHLGDEDVPEDPQPGTKGSPAIGPEAGGSSAGQNGIELKLEVVPTTVKTPYGYIAGQHIVYNLWLYNNTDEEVHNVKFWDVLHGTKEESFIGEVTSVVHPHSQTYRHLSYEVTPGDANIGYVYNLGHVAWTYADGSPGEGDTNTFKEDTFKTELSVTLSVEGGEEQVFHPDDTIPFVITVHNNNSVSLDKVSVYQLPGKVFQLSQGTKVASGVSIAAHADYVVKWPHKVSPEDLGNGYVEGSAAAFSGYASDPPVYSNHVKISVQPRPEDPTPPNPPEDPGNPDPYPPDLNNRPYGTVSCWKDYVGGPANGKFYQENETVHFQIHISNGMDAPILNVTVYDYLSASPGQVIATYAMIPAYSGEAAPFDYVVDGLDVEIGSVTNMGVVTYMDSYGSFCRVPVGPVTVDTGKETETDDDPGADIPRVSSTVDCCERILLGVGKGVAEYRQYYCHTHSPIAGQINAQLEKAETDEERLSIWQNAVSDWTSALNLEYDQLLDQASAADRPVFEAERAAFEALADAARNEWAALYPDSPALVEEKLAGLLMNRCTELCYELHAAPAQRLDSRLSSWFKELESPEPDAKCTREVTPKESSLIYRKNLCDRHRISETTVEYMLGEATSTDALDNALISARYLWSAEQDVLIKSLCAAAGSEAASAVFAERSAFTAWLAAWESELKLIYPDDSVTVNEMIANVLSERVLDLCEAK